MPWEGEDGPGAGAVGFCTSEEGTRCNVGHDLDVRCDEVNADKRRAEDLPPEHSRVIGGAEGVVRRLDLDLGVGVEDGGDGVGDNLVGGIDDGQVPELADGADVADVNRVFGGRSNLDEPRVDGERGGVEANGGREPDGDLPRLARSQSERRGGDNGGRADL